MTCSADLQQPVIEHAKPSLSPSHSGYHLTCTCLSYDESSQQVCCHLQHEGKKSLTKLESQHSSPSQRKGRPSCARKPALLNNFSRHLHRSSCSFASCEVSSSPTSHIVAGSVIIFNTESSWHRLTSCLENLAVASFQFEKPVEINACSKQWADCSRFS